MIGAHVLLVPKSGGTLAYMGHLREYQAVPPLVRSLQQSRGEAFTIPAVPGPTPKSWAIVGSRSKL